MTSRLLPILPILLGLSAAPATSAPSPVTITLEDQYATMENGMVRVAIDLKAGQYSLIDPKSGRALIADAGMLPQWDASTRATAHAGDPADDALGRGRTLTVSIIDWNFHRHGMQGAAHSAPPRRLVTFTLHEGSPAMVLGFGVEHPVWFRSRLMGATPLSRGIVFPDAPLDHPMTLNGAAGADPALVLPGLTRLTPNSLLLTGLAGGKRRSMVCGGLSNKEFGKFIALRDGSLDLGADDPVGRLIDPGQRYVADDTFYIDAVTSDPFVALEQFGQAMRKANRAAPKVYDFPVLCGWGVGALSKLPDVNTSAKLVGELELAGKAGVTRYTKVGIRLEPDTYNDKDNGNTQQGWWDDAHWAKYGHLVPPYETFAKWCPAIAARDGIPYTYFQVGMPSDDYARAHPGHMLFNDISQLDRRHRHHQPFVSFDYTDPDFQKHLLATWQRLKAEGLMGVKFDYPETGWRPEGGFEDPYATTNAAYRKVFELAREGLGPEAFLDERNLGESGRPCLDVTAGLVDSQRTWGDSNEFVPAMITTDGLRWYKNRVVFNYYPDSKVVHGCPAGIRQSMLTMVYLTSGRIDLATSFSLFTPEITHDFTRIYPHYPEPRTARPLDAFTGIRDPQVYDLALEPGWHQVALYNTGDARSSVSTALSGDPVDNAMGLDPHAAYHAYEFWSDTYLGRLPGTARLAQDLDSGHCAMISVRAALPHPQVVSTNRHVLQGWVDLDAVSWDAETRSLSGIAHVVEGEPFRIAIARNGFRDARLPETSAPARLEAHPGSPDLSVLVLDPQEGGPTRWKVAFSPAE